MFIKNGEVTWCYWKVFVFHSLNLFLWEFSLREQIHGFQNFLGNTSFYLLNIFATATPKWEQNFSKIIFSFLGVVKCRNCLDASPLLTLGWNLPSKFWLRTCWWQCIRKLFNCCKQIAPAVVTRVLLFALPTIFAIQNSLSPLVQKESDCKVQTLGRDGHDLNLQDQIVILKIKIVTWSWSLRSHYFNDLILIFKIAVFVWSWSWRSRSLWFLIVA